MTRTVKVRVAVVVTSTGEWNAVGWSKYRTDVDAMETALSGLEDDGSAESRFFLTAELPIPEYTEVAANVGKAEP